MKQFIRPKACDRTGITSPGRDRHTEGEGADMAKGKRYSDAIKRYDTQHLHAPYEAVDVVKRLSSARFDETVELAVRLGVDPRKADQMVRGTVGLPSGTGKDVRVAVFAAGDAAAAAREAGADFVGADDLVEQVTGGMMDFDVAIATPDLMPQVGKLGRVLGPRGLMPNPKTGTVTTDVAKAVTDFKGGKVEYRTDRYGNVHVPLGKSSFGPEALIDNYRAVVEELERAKPAAAKGRYFKKITLSSTMGPGIKVDTNRRDAYAAEV
jgi:large subunit ribosomal protein L1